MHHPTKTIATDRDGRRAYENLLSAQDLVFAHEPLATLGESLALCRGRISFQRLDTGDVAAAATHTDSIMLAETDARGLRRRTEFFAVDRLADAAVRLYERYAALLGDDGARERAATTARSLAAVLGPFELDRYAAGIAPDVIFMDHRVVGFPSGRGSSELLRSVGSLLEAADDVATRVDDVLAVRADALVLRWATFGTARLGHGPFEWQFLRLLVFGADGLLERAEQFDVDRDGDALAAFDESARDARQERFANAAVRLQRQVERLWRERDWDAVAAAFNSEALLDDRRALVGMALGGAQFFANMRMLFETAASRWQSELCATRGERLALFRVRCSGELAGGGQFVDEHLAVIECDERGLRSALVVFDLDAVGAAYAELDRRFAAGEGAPYAELLMRQEAFRHAAAANDREALARLLPPDVSIVSQRRFANIGAPMSRDEYLAGVGVLGDLGVDADTARSPAHLADGRLGDSRWYGGATAARSRSRWCSSTRMTAAPSWTGNSSTPTRSRRRRRVSSVCRRRSGPGHVHRRDSGRRATARSAPRVPRHRHARRTLGAGTRLRARRERRCHTPVARVRSPARGRGAGRGPATVAARPRGRRSRRPHDRADLRGRRSGRGLCDARCALQRR